MTGHNKPLRRTASSRLPSSMFSRSLHPLVVSSRPTRRTRSRPSSVKVCGASKPSQASSCTTSSIAWAATELRAYRPEAIKTELLADISGSRSPSRSAPGVVADGAARHAGQRTGRHARRPHRPVPTSRRRPISRRRPRRRGPRSPQGPPVPRSSRRLCPPLGPGEPRGSSSSLGPGSRADHREPQGSSPQPGAFY